MKSAYAIIVLIFLEFCLFSQDTIYLENKLYLPGKVMEISDEDVVFQNLNSQSTTFQIMEKREIDFIKFKSGELDHFERKNKTYHKHSPNKTSLDQTLLYKDRFVIKWPTRNFQRRKSNIYYENQDSRNLINKELLGRIISLEPDSIKKGEMEKHYMVMKRRKTISRFVINTGIAITVIGLSSAFGAYMTYSINGNTTLILPAALFLGAGFTIGGMSYFTKVNEKKAIQNMVNSLNK